MKFKNLETDSIIVVDKKDVARIEKLKGYPDKFEVIEEIPKEEKIEETPKFSKKEK